MTAVRPAKLNDRGMVLVTALLLVSLLSLLGATYMTQTITDLTISANYRDSREIFYAAEGGLAYAAHVLNHRLNTLNSDLNITPPSAPPGFTFEEFEIKPPGSTEIRTLTSGPWAGLIAFVRPFEIIVRASGENDASSRIESILEDQMIPVFQFGIFYERNLEMNPGPNMTFSGTPRPRIHSNEDIYLRPNNTLSLDATVTSATDIFRRRLDGTSPGNGTIRIRDGNGDWQNMTIDSDSPNWATDSQSIWNGNVRTGEHGVMPLNLPMPTEDSRDVIGTGSESMHDKAGLKIIDGVATDAAGNTVSLTYTDPNDPGVIIDPISTHSFYDQREGRVVEVTQVNMDQLLASPAVVAALNNPPTDQDAGILYVSGTDAVRLTEGADLSAMGTGGLTVATDRPLYVQGDYNLANAPAAILADAVTVLSNNWSDANSELSTQNLSERVASDTTLNAALMTGNVESTAGGQYSGGIENFPRFLENWTSRNFNYSGSLVCLWESEHATGNWAYGGRVYTAPNRNWSYGMDFNNLPPGTPRVRSMTVGAWIESGIRD